MHVRHRGGRKIKKKKMKHLQKLQLAKMSEMITIKPQETSAPTICNDNLQDNQCNESEELESTKKEILINASNNPHLHNSSLKEEKYKDVNVTENSREETASTANMSSNVKEQLMDICVAYNSTNMDTNDIPSTHQIISDTVPDNSFSNGSSISSDNLKANNAHQTEDSTGSNRRPPLLPLLSSCGHRSSSHTIQTTSSVSTPFPSMIQTTSSVSSASAPFSMTHTTASVSSVLASFPTLTRTISSTSPMSHTFRMLKSLSNVKVDSPIEIQRKETCTRLQNCIAKQLSRQNICKPFDLDDYSFSDKMFLLSAAEELEKIPEPEKLKRKLAIMDILWKPL